MAQFQSVSSLSFSASVTLMLNFPTPCTECPNFVPEPGQPCYGEVQYRTAGDRYKESCYLDPEKYGGMQTQVAYDGQRFQLLRSDGTLSYSSQDAATLLPLLPNPMLQLLQFRYPLTDENYQFEVRFKDVLHDQVPEELNRVEWTLVDDGGRQLERAVFPGGTYEGNAYVHHVFVVPGSRNMPVRIDRVTANGRLTSSEFSNYQRLDAASGPTFWPRDVLLRTFDASGAEVGRIGFSLSDIAVDVDYRAEDFAIDPNSALRIWDDDQQKFL
jgi:hypothetical protein